MTVSMIKTASPSTVFVLNAPDLPEHNAVRIGLNRSSWLSAKGITEESRATLRAVCAGERVQVADVVAAVVDGLSANATRFGQSMARRAGRQPLLDLFALLPQVDAVPDIERQHRAQVEQSQARTIAEQQTSLRTAQQEIHALRRALQAAEINRPQAADSAANDFAYDLLTADQRQRVSDFRTGYRAAQSRG